VFCFSLTTNNTILAKWTTWSDLCPNAEQGPTLSKTEQKFTPSSTSHHALPFEVFQRQLGNVITSCTHILVFRRQLRNVITSCTHIYSVSHMFINLCLRECSCHYQMMDGVSCLFEAAVATVLPRSLFTAWNTQAVVNYLNIVDCKQFVFDISTACWVLNLYFIPVRTTRFVCLQICLIWIHHTRYQLRALPVVNFDLLQYA
jgi:hypothetical protein